MIIKKEIDEILDFLSDAANFKGHCEGVYFPETEEELIQLIKEANQSKTKLTIAGNGTGLTGARVPQGGYVVSMQKLNSIIEINKSEKTATVQPAVVLNDFQNKINQLGLFYPPDPTETNCFIGATIATNSSGAKTFEYGSTRNFVLEINVVLPDGDTITLTRGKNFSTDKELTLQTDSGRNINLSLPEIKMPETKNSAGYFIKPNMDAIDLFNFVHEAIRLSKAKNETITARAIEFFDSFSLDFIRDDFPEIPAGKVSAIWVEQEFTKREEDEIFEAWINLIKKHHADVDQTWIAFDKTEQQKFKTFRHQVSWNVSEYVARNEITKIGTDTAVPLEKFKEYYNYCVNVVKNEKIKFINYGHIGDSHLHLNMLPKNKEEYERAKLIYSTLCKRAVELGGTVSAEHGIGKFKKQYLKMMYGEQAIIQMAKMKKALDPNCILNIDNIIDEKYLREN